MMNVIKNILFVSYLKNKGVRRICFILGILLAILPTMIWYQNIHRHFYHETYENILEYSKKPFNKYNEEKQRAIFNKYPVDFETTAVITFNDWQNFLFEYSNDKKSTIRFYLEKCYALKNGIKDDIEIPELTTKNYYKIDKVTPEMLLVGARILKKKGYTPKQVDAWLHTHDSSLEQMRQLAHEELQKVCPKLKQYMTQEISISKANYWYLLKLLWSLLCFYLPFLLSCIVKWVYTGFKEK